MLDTKEVSRVSNALHKRSVESVECLTQKKCRECRMLDTKEVLGGWNAWHKERVGRVECLAQESGGSMLDTQEGS